MLPMRKLAAEASPATSLIVPGQLAKHACLTPATATESLLPHQAKPAGRGRLKAVAMSPGDRSHGLADRPGPEHAVPS